MSVILTMRDSRTWYRSSARVMGTVAEIVIDGDADQVSNAFARLRALEACWTRFNDDSELSWLHRRAGRWVDVSDAMLSALHWCHRLSEETAGIFDPTIRRSLEEAGYCRTFADIVDDPTPLPVPVASAGVGAIELDRPGRRARLAPGVLVDLGGVGKGLAADIVAEELVLHGARAAFVSVGGDIHVAGEPPDEASWSVPLLHPATGAPIATHLLREGGLVMSSVAARRWRRGADEVHHIIDPRTGRSAATDLVGVAVACRSAARGEALAKAAIVLGAEHGATMLRAANVRAWLIGPADVQLIEEASCWP